MITCPECGQQANDGARFCDRCGQGLDNAAKAPYLPPLKDGTELSGGFKIVALISQSSLENRYHAERTRNGALAYFQLRERSSPEGAADFSIPEAESTSEPKEVAEDPAGPHAKTAELKLKDSAPDKTAPDDTSASASEFSSSPAMNTTAVEAKTEEDRGWVIGDEESGDSNHDVDEAETPVADAAIVTSVNDAPFAADEVTATPEVSASVENEPVSSARQDDLGEVFGRVLALSLTLNHPALQRALEGFADNGRVYMVYPDEELTPLSRRMVGKPTREVDAVNVIIQVCQAVAFVHRRGLRLNDICPDSVAYGADGRIKLTGLEYVSNDNELQAEPIFNDGYTAPEIYRRLGVDKRADLFSVAALLYTCLTGARLDSETWVEEAGTIRFYPPHVVTPALEQVVRRALAITPAQRFPNIDAFKAELVRLNSIVRPQAAALTDVGMVREHNEDAVMAIAYQRDSLVEPAQNFLYVVADGMGGAAAGEIASAIAVSAMRRYVEGKLAAGAIADLSELLRMAIEHANEKVLAYQAAHPESRGMGSTAVSALIVPPEAAIAWIGDSRAYLCDNSGLRQVTKDHSLVQRLIELGQITAEQARHHEHKNVITRSLGARQRGVAGAEALALKLKRGDRLMLCSDGLTTHVEDHEISKALRRHEDPYEAARELVVAANAGGGTDNVSVVVIHAV
ncbi:MAG: Stp1/IreP family PP2C-type Ser/Thr phosphatase [Candidatus Binataceae bacterium]